MKKGLVLQGGGAKGAFQVGAMRALMEHNYKFDCIVGASIGALNAAIFAMGDVDVAYKAWNELEMIDVLPITDNVNQNGFISLMGLAGTALNALRSGGMDTAKIRAILDKYIDEDRLRASKINFGLVTVEDGETGKVLKKMFLKDIPAGKVNDFIMASGALPIFKKVEIDGVRYLDGGLMDNLPISMLVDAGYSDIVAIRLGGNLTYTPKNGEVVNIMYIDPSDKIGSIMNFNNESLRKAVNLGYYDTCRMINGLFGKKYYIKPFTEHEMYSYLYLLPVSFYDNTLKELDVSIGGTVPQKAALLTYKLSQLLQLENENTEVIWVRFAEIFAEYYGVNRWEIRSILDLLKTIATSNLEKSNKVWKKDKEDVKTKEEKAEKVMLNLIKVLKENFNDKK